MNVKPRKPYPSDPQRRAVGHLGAVVAAPGEGGAPRTADLREVLNTISYVLSTSCAWSALPHDFPPEGTVRDYFHRWRRNGLWQPHSCRIIGDWASTNLVDIGPEHRPPFRTEPEPAVELLRWAKARLGLSGDPLRVVADGAYA